MLTNGAFLELEAYFVGTLHTDGNNSRHLVPCPPSMYCDEDTVGFFLILGALLWVHCGCRKDPAVSNLSEEWGQ